MFFVGRRTMNLGKSGQPSPISTKESLTRQFLEELSFVFLLTASSQEEAEKIAITLIENKLAACVNVTEVNSFYTWEEKINRDREWQLIIKTDLSKFPSLSAKIQELHSYQLPEIIALPIIAGSQNYLNWIQQQVQS